MLVVFSPTERDPQQQRSAGVQVHTPSVWEGVQQHGCVAADFKRCLRSQQESGHVQLHHLPVRGADEAGPGRQGAGQHE